jgi:large subunit ribosomal protein L6
VSRIAKIPVTIPSGVTVNVDRASLKVKGSKGELVQPLHSSVLLEVSDKEIAFSRADDSPESSVMIGTMRSLVNNMVIGVTQGFTKELKMVGVGYRAQVAENVLKISAGFSHPVELTMPAGITVECPNPTDIIVKGIDKQVVGQQAAIIRAIRPPEPYKGKGIRYVNEVIQLKEGKKK